VGYGGSCFPKDVKALMRTADQTGCAAELIAAVDHVNDRQKRLLADKIIQYFKASTQGVAGRVIAVWGLAFKANTDDIRESPALSTIQSLTEAGMRVKAYDPEAGDNARAVLSENTHVQILADQYACLEQADALAVLTDWNQFRNPDFSRVKSLLQQPVLFDGRNLYSSSYLYSLGFYYACIGRPTLIPPDEEGKIR
jgi:UDPglucose 6-dehydrogenase